MQPDLPMTGARNPLRNRCDPFGALHAVAACGLFTGNRGVIHDPDTRASLKRRWTTKAWIICALEHPRGLRRVPMGRNGPAGRAGWTELFFLDEPTALAAGHRPCFYCRREAARSFAGAWSEANGIKNLTAPDIDRRLHAERNLSAGRLSTLAPEEVAELPDGAFVAHGGQAFAVRLGRLFPWSFTGYAAPLEFAQVRWTHLRLLTPPSTVAALAAGYASRWHPSAA